MKFLSVAWVPDDDPERAWDAAASLAANWVDRLSNQSRASAVLVTNTLTVSGVPVLGEFERRHSRTSRLAKRDRVPAGEGPVLSYVPQVEDLHFAMTLARNSHLAVVEGGSFPLRGWAAWFEAEDLVKGQPTSPLPPVIREAVDRLAFHGNNGFADMFGKKVARSIFDEVAAETILDVELILGAALASGVLPRGIENLKRLVSRT